jgi:putative ABC transport system permease protein
VILATTSAAAGGSLVSGPVTFGDVALSLLLVVAAIAVSRWRAVGLEGDMGIATVRSFVQLVAVGYVLDYVFKGHGWLTTFALAVMIITAALTSGGRARRVPASRLIAGAAISLSTAGTLGVLAALQIVPVSARAIIPLGSMIITSAMNTTSVVMTRFYEDLAASRREVEARLSLAQSAREAALPWQRAALRTGMIPTVDQTKVVGLVALPGAMTGMILAGASPLAAIRLQLVVMYMLLGGNAFAALIASELSARRLFTPAQQLIRSLRRAPG